MLEYCSRFYLESIALTKEVPLFVSEEYELESTNVMTSTYWDDKGEGIKQDGSGTDVAVVPTHHHLV